MSHADWPPHDEEREIVWNAPLSPLNIPDEGLELPEGDAERQVLFEGMPLSQGDFPVIVTSNYCNTRQLILIPSERPLSLASLLLAHALAASLNAAYCLEFRSLGESFFRQPNSEHQAISLVVVGVE